MGVITDTGAGTVTLLTPVLSD